MGNIYRGEDEVIWWPLAFLLLAFCLCCLLPARTYPPYPLCLLKVNCIIMQLLFFCVRITRTSEISRGRGAAKFRYIREIPRKLIKTREIPRNSLEIVPNTCRYNIFETYLGYWSCLLAVNVQIYLESSSLPRGNNVPKLPGVLRLMLRKPGHNKREDFSLTLYGM